MSRSGNAFIAATQGPQFTLYAAMRALGIPLSPEQAKFQAYLEREYGQGEDEQMKCQQCRKETGGCKNGEHFKKSQGCYGPKHDKRR